MKPNWLDLVYELVMNEVVVGSNHAAVTQTSDIVPASSKQFLDIQANYRVWIHSKTRT